MAVGNSKECGKEQMIKGISTIKGILLCLAVIFFAGCASVQSHKYNIESIKRHSENQIKLIRKMRQEWKITAELAKKTKEILDIFDEATKLFKEGALDKAEELYKKASQLSDDEFLRNHPRLANKELTRHKKNEKREILRPPGAQDEQSGKTTKNFPTVQTFDINSKAKSLYQKKFYDEAITKFKEPLEMDPKNETAQLYIKIILLEKEVVQMKKEQKQPL